MSALVRTDLHIVAGNRRIAHLKKLACSAHSADGLEMSSRLIETLTESVIRLRAYRAVIVKTIFDDEKSGEGCPDNSNPVFYNPGAVGQLARAIDKTIGALVASHGTQAAAEGKKSRMNCYSEIEALRRELEVLGVDRSEMLPYMERLGQRSY